MSFEKRISQAIAIFGLLAVILTCAGIPAGIIYRLFFK